MGSKRDEQDIRRKLAQACRILYMEGLADYNLGHASCRVPGRDEVFIKPRGLGLEEITPDDVIVVDIEGKRLEGTHSPHGETLIHTEIYKVKSDVQSVVHVHPVLCTAFSSVRVPIKSLNQDGVFFSRGVPIFENPELINTKEKGRMLAETFGDNDALLLRNHGIVTVGRTTEEACLMALFFENALRIQLHAASFGTIEAMSEETAMKMYRAFKKNPKRNEEIWHYLVRKLKRQGLAFD